MTGCKVVLLGGAALMALSTAAFAQEADEAGATDEVVVTAERRAQSLQDYAGVAQAVSGEDLQALGVDQVEDLQSLVPGLNIANQEGNVQIYIRGVGTSNNTELGDPSAATHFNGVYLPRPRGVGGMFFDLERVEVTKGPQGTLRGRNAVAGTLNIIPVAPKLGRTEGYVQGEIGNYDTTGYEAALNVPLGDQAAARFSVYGVDRGSAFENVGNKTSLRPTGEQELFSARASLLWQPTDRLRVSFVADYEDEEGTGYPSVNIQNALVGGREPDEFDLRGILFRGPQGRVDSENWGLALTAAYDFGPAVLEYTGSRRFVDFYQVNASNEGIVRPGYGPANVDYDNFGTVFWLTRSWSNIHELRLTSPADSKMVWSTGLFYFDETQDVGFLSIVDRGLFYSGTEFTMPDVDSKSTAIYADVTYPVTDQLRIKAGLRYTEEEKSRFGVGGNYTLGLGSDGFGCCFVTRLGTEGFQPLFMDRANYVAPGSNPAATAAYFAQALIPGARDTILAQIAGVADGSRPNGTCVNTPDTQPSYGGQVCPANGQHSFFTLTGPGQQQGEYKDEFLDYRAGVEYDISPRNLVYATVSTGHKSGGFNDTITVNNVSLAPIFTPEELISYEIGTKNTFYFGDVRADLNANVFWYDYTDQVFQTLVAIGGAGSSAGYSQQNVNAANSTVKGLEVEGRFSLPWRMRLDVNAAFLDAEIDNGSIFDTRAETFGADTPNYRVDISGNALPNVSGVNLSAHWQKTAELFGGRADFHLLANYRSSYFLSVYNEDPVVRGKLPTEGQVIDPSAPPSGLTVTDARTAGFWGEQDGFTTFNVGFGWEPASGRYRLEAYGNNITDETVVEKQQVSNANLNLLFLNQPRTYGARLRVSF